MAVVGFGTYCVSCAKIDLVVYKSACTPNRTAHVLFGAGYAQFEGFLHVVGCARAGLAVDLPAIARNAGT